MGVRVALGATRGQVMRLILRGSLWPIVLGLFIGLPLASAAGFVLGSQLYGMKPLTPLVLLVASFALLLAAMLASLAPARRASLISPVDALRSE